MQILYVKVVDITLTFQEGDTYMTQHDIQDSLSRIWGSFLQDKANGWECVLAGCVQDVGGRRFMIQDVVSKGLVWDMLSW
jgi:hypothetical protein